MNPYAIPGHVGLTEKYIIDLVREAFELKLYLWVKSKSKVDEFCVPRQVLMATLLDFCDYTTKAAGLVCHKDHATAIHAHRVVHETLMNDPCYGERVRAVYDHLREQNKLNPSRHTGGFRVGEK